MLHKEKPNLENLPEWGTHVFVLREGHNKLDEKADEGRWVGYSSDSQGHHVYWPGKHRVTVERNVAFDATVLVQQDSMAEGERNTPGVSQTPATTHATPPPNVSPPDPLQGFEPEAEGRG